MGSDGVTTIRWGIIGCGDVCEVKSGPALQKADGSALVAVMRRDGAKARDFAERHGVSHWFDDADAVIRHPEVDAVYVATPTSTHKDYTLRAAAAGKPVYVEKPMAMSPDECQAMIDACAEAGVGLYVAYYRRALPRFEALRTMAQDGTLGTVRMVTVRQFRRAGDAVPQPWKLDPAVNGGGLFVDMQVHVLDWLDQAFGPALAVAGLARNQTGRMGGEDAVGLSVAYEGNVVASFACGYAADKIEDAVTLIGDKGRVTMGFMAHTPITLETEAGRQVVDIADPAHVHQPLVQQIVDHLRGGPEPASSGQNGLRVAQVVEQLLA